MNDKPKLLIPVESYRKIMAYVDLCSGEVTWFFDVDYDQSRHALVVGETYLLNQQAGSAHVDMDEETVAGFLEELIESGVTQMPRGWGHSHAQMEAFFSTTDTSTIDDLTNNSFIVALVVNKKREMKCTLKICSPFTIILNELPIEIEVEYGQIPAEIVEEVRQKVQSTPLTTVYSNYKTGANYSGHNQSGYPYGATKKVVHDLPKDKEKALQKIEQYGLIRYWDIELKEFAFIDPEINQAWRDKWKVISFADYTAIRGVDDSIRDGIKKNQRRCLTCKYAEQFHNDNLCSLELYDDDFYDVGKTEYDVN